MSYRHAHQCAFCAGTNVIALLKHAVIFILTSLDRVPNIPFFYLVYRAWSHWRALSGGRHIKFLLDKSLLVYNPSPILDEVYSRQRPPLPSTPESTAIPGEPKNESPHIPDTNQTSGSGEVMLLSQANGKQMAQALGLPQLEVELERALWQVEETIKKQNNERIASKRDGKKDDTKSQ